MIVGSAVRFTLPAGLLARIDGATYASALLRGAVAFAGNATLSLALLTFVLAAL
jgi:hypothetical protein